jgi:hypothetical protein
MNLKLNREYTKFIKEQNGVRFKALYSKGKLRYMFFYTHDINQLTAIKTLDWNDTFSY